MEEVPARRLSRWRIALCAVTALAVLALGALWIQRKPIAAGFVDRTLAARGVRGSYRIVELGVRRQRLENVRIGDPASPDLVAAEVELTVGYGLGGPEVRTIAAKGVRLRGRLSGGRVSFGAIDRLLPKSSGGPFALPDLAVDLADARMRLATPAGPIGVALDGGGNLADGFRGRLAVVAHALDLGACRLSGATANLDIGIAARRPAFAGPARIGAGACGGAGFVGARADVDARLGQAFDRWDGAADVAIAAVTQGTNRIERIAGRIGFAGDAKSTRGALHLASGPVHGAGARALTARLDGAYALGSAEAGPTVVGRFGLGHAAFPATALGSLEGVTSSASGTPLAPLGSALASALRRFAGDADVEARLSLVSRSGGGVARLSELVAVGVGGARLTAGGGSGLTYQWPTGGVRVDTALAASGGGLPDVRATLRQASVSAPLVGEARIAPYAAGDARIAVTPIGFAAEPDGSGRFATRVTIDGPLAGGRVSGLSLSLDARLARGGGLALNRACSPLAFAALEVAGARFGPTRLTLCPTGEALVVRSQGGLRGGGRIAAPRLAGRSGNAPLLVAAEAVDFTLGDPGFRVKALAVRLGAAASQTQLDVPSIDGRIGKGGISGAYAGAAGRIGNVPLLLSEGNGRWRLTGGALDLEGRVRVADAAATPRFQPLVSPDVRLRLLLGIVTASGTLHEPTGNALVSKVALRHDLATGKGGATLDVPELRFGKALQPEALTRLTLGVIANVEGALSGKGEIAWSPAAVTSTGRFRTDHLNLAAAFGPVTGIKGQIVFSDLLGLETAPGQTVTIAEVNPGVVVADGVVRYQLLSGQRVRVEGGRWPFSGGALILRPTAMDFGQPSARHLSFEVEGLDAARFVQQLQFENIAATGTFDGVVPMVFDENGGRIAGGRLVARQGGGTLAYVGEITKAQLGVFGKLAFDALKSVRYQALSIDLDGALDGEIVSRVLFNGVNQQPLSSETPFTKTLQRLPFKFNIVIRAPFRGLVGSARSFADPSQLVRDTLPARTPAAAKPGQAPVQPQDSGDRP